MLTTTQREELDPLLFWCRFLAARLDAIEYLRRQEVQRRGVELCRRWGFDEMCLRSRLTMHETWSDMIVVIIYYAIDAPYAGTLLLSAEAVGQVVGRERYESPVLVLRVSRGGTVCEVPER